MTWRDLQSLTWRRMMHLRRFQMCFFFFFFGFLGFWSHFLPCWFNWFLKHHWNSTNKQEFGMTPSNWILQNFHRLWVGHPDLSNSWCKCRDDLFFWPKRVLALVFRSHLQRFGWFFFRKKKIYPQFSTKPETRYPSKNPTGFGFWMFFFFFQIPHFDLHRKKNSKVPGSEVQLWLEELGLGRYFGLLQVTPDGWIGGWVGCKEDAEDLPLDLHPQKEWVGVCIGKWFSLKLFEGCDVNFWEFARKCRKQVKGFLSLLSCSCNFLHCKSISMTDLPVICS